MIFWYEDSSCGVHKDMRSHTGSVYSLGKECIVEESTKQKVNTRSSTEAELVAVDDKISKIIWTKGSIGEQGFKNSSNILYEDNKSTVQLQNNGEESSGQQTRYFDIKCFCRTDIIKRKKIEVKFYPSDEMTANNCMTKPLTGDKLLKHRNNIMNWQH